jgi:hypothetical protein
MAKKSLFAFVCTLALATSVFAVTEKELVEAAKKEGSLNLTTNFLYYGQVLVDGFKKKYPFIKINHSRFEPASKSFYDDFETEDPNVRLDAMLRCQDRDLMDWYEAK